MEPSDEDLCRRIAERDDRAFEQLVERHQKRAYRLAWSVLGDAEEAKDLSQEAFLRLYEKASSFDGRAKFSTWFHRLLLNLCLDRRRQRHGWLRRIFRPGSTEDSQGSRDASDWLEQQPSPDDDPATEVEKKDTISKVWKAASRLSAQQRAALVLQVEEDLPTSEIATVLGCSEATVRVHLHRAVSTLRRMMTDG